MDVEQRARELYAKHAEQQGYPMVALQAREGLFDPNPSMRAIVEALTPPVGHVSRAELNSAQDAAFLDGVFKGVGGIPEGYVLVPVEPTEAMQIAVEKANTWLIRYEAPEIWAAMLAARPEVKP